MYAGSCLSRGATMPGRSAAYTPPGSGGGIPGMRCRNGAGSSGGSDTALRYDGATVGETADVDDTAVVAMAMDRAQNLKGETRYREPIERAREWIFGMQCKNGGWGAFDAENTHYYLNHIPFADHGALLDPPTEDVSARCVSMLAQLGDMPGKDKRVAEAIAYLRRAAPVGTA